MEEAFVDLTCPVCNAHWEDKPHELPALETRWECRECGERRTLSVFMDSKTDLEIVQQFDADSD